MSADLFGYAPPSAAFKDIRGTRPSVAEEKAQLALVLGRMLKHVPASVRNGSINLTREWRQVREAARKVYSSSRSSVQQLSSAINSFDRFGA